MKFQDGGSNSTLTDRLHDAYLFYPRSLRLHQCLGHDIHRKWSYLDKIGSNLNNSAGRIENGGSLSRWYNDDYTRLRKLICLYMLHTHMLHDVSRFSGSAVSKGIKKKLISQPSVNVHTCFFATGITGLFSGLAVSKVETKKQNANTENTAGAFHLKNEKPFANRCKSAKNQLRSVKMLFGSELICNTLAWHFRVSHYCVTTSWLTFVVLLSSQTIATFW